MLTAIKKRMGRDEDEGFTLIELMVVVLIIAILLAIAIPTFLGARNSANARSTQSNLRNALTAEETNWTNTQAFTGDASSIEPSLTWGTDPTALAKGAKSVAAIVSGSDAVTLVGFGKDNNCYAIYQSNSATTASDFTAYAAWKMDATNSNCTTPTAPTAKPTAAGSGAIGAAAPAGNADWYASW